MWLGLIEAPPKAAYVWEGSKSPLNYSNWDSKQPDNSPGVLKLSTFYELYEQLFHTKVFCADILYLQYVFVIFWHM